MLQDHIKHAPGAVCILNMVLEHDELLHNILDYFTAKSGAGTTPWVAMQWAFMKCSLWYDHTTSYPAVTHF